MTEPGNLRRRADEQGPTGTEASPHDTERSGSDRRQADRRAGERRSSGDRRGRLMQRWRQPIVGLGLAGLAFPMAKATTSAEPAPEAEPAQEDQDLSSVAVAEDTEEVLAEQIAESRADEARSRQVDQAVDRYGIDRDLAEDIYDAAREASIEPRLAYGLVKTESTFNERAVSSVGARGLTQVMPRTAAWLVPGTRTQDLYDRDTNLRLGFTYLNQMIDKYKGDVRLALLAYNRGPGTVDKVLKQGGNPDNGYADKVLRG